MSGTNTNIAANSTTTNVLAGLNYEFLPYDAHVEIYAVRDAAAGTVNLTANVGQDVAIDDNLIPFVGTSISTADHLVDQFDAEEGSRLTLRFRETAGVATSDVVWMVNITPLE